jgi:hypothetical protein
MSKVRCKFRCIQKIEQIGWGEHPILWSYEFQAVTQNSEENKKFWAATPAGKLSVTSISAELFQVGQEYYMDLISAG